MEGGAGSRNWLLIPSTAPRDCLSHEPNIAGFLVGCNEERFVHPRVAAVSCGTPLEPSKGHNERASASDLILDNEIYGASLLPNLPFMVRESLTLSFVDPQMASPLLLRTHFWSFVPGSSCILDHIYGRVSPLPSPSLKQCGQHLEWRRKVSSLIDIQLWFGAKQLPWPQHLIALPYKSIFI